MVSLFLYGACWICQGTVCNIGDIEKSKNLSIKSDSSGYQKLATMCHGLLCS
jgi:hypothetical protein